MEQPNLLDSTDIGGDLCPHSAVSLLGKSNIPRSIEIYYDSFDLYDRRYFRFKLNYLLCIVHVFKIMIVLRALMNSTQYAKPRAVRLSQMYGNDCGYVSML